MADEELEQEEYEDVRRSLVCCQGRTIYFFAEVNAASVLEAIRWIDYLEARSNKDEITLVINSKGGEIYDGLALYDRMRGSFCPITTIGTGLVASMAFIIFLAGDKRIGTKTVRFLNHQASAQLTGKVTDIKIEQIETDSLEKECLKIITERTSQSAKRIKKDIKIGDKYIHAEEALATHVIHVIQDYAPAPTGKVKNENKTDDSSKA
jgi:ATP-dependent Clp protease protease subunit